MDWKNKYELEIQRAIDVRKNGNEGQSRVCARRAAGIVARTYFQRRNGLVPGNSAYDLLKKLQELDDLPEDVRREAEYLTLRVNEEFNLPASVDLILAAQRLAQHLLPDVDLG
jgi:hypothetical protein